MKNNLFIIFALLSVFLIAGCSSKKTSKPVETQASQKDDVKKKTNKKK
ncbi:MAG: hypothetical protein JNM93_04275 [Bacteriovoracaceae bacterium]|nr:hypothetical protein [Bacteriovoracaceae bacterium]